MAAVLVTRSFSWPEKKQIPSGNDRKKSKCKKQVLRSAQDDNSVGMLKEKDMAALKLRSNFRYVQRMGNAVTLAG